jgi:adenylate cyclase
MVSGLTPRKNLRDLLKQLTIGGVLAAVVLLFTQDFLLTLSPLERFELSTIDYRFRLRGPITTARDSANIVIVEISQESFKSLPDKWPWPRSYYARLVRNLKRAGAKVVGIDIVFSETDAHSPKNDEEFRTAIREAGIVVLAGKTEIASDKYVIRRERENYSNLFFDVDSSIGIVYVRNDEDGVYRRYRPFAVDPAANRRIPSFSFAVLNKFLGKPPFYTAENTAFEFVYAGKHIPKVDAVSMLINYYGPDRTFPHYKFADVIDDGGFTTIDERESGEDINTFDDPDFGYLYDGTFKNKIVLVGSTMPEDKDLFPVPIAQGKQVGDNLMYGVEIHANTIQNVLDGNFLRREPQWMRIVSVFVFCIFTFLATTKIKEIKFKRQIVGDLLGAVVMAAELTAIAFASVRLFSDYTFVAAVTSPALAVVFGYVGATAYNYVTERKQKVMIKGMFSTYVNPSVVDEIVAHPEKLRLGGERKELTVMFSDIEGFTSFAEPMQPERLVSILNEYLSRMTDVVFKNEGTLDKYEGDAIMAFWGAPTPQSDHALRACRAAVQMQEQLEVLRSEWKAQDKPAINVRIGINTGEMIVGNMGGRGRFDYTVIGDCVNLGARLESANRQYRTKIMIGEQTYAHISEHIVARQLDLLVVKGKTEPVAVYELVSMIGDAVPQNKLEVLRSYDKGFQQYRARDWKGAMQSFQEALDLDPNDYPSYLYLERSGIYSKNPPGPEWDGVFVLRTK